MADTATTAGAASGPSPQPAGDNAHRWAEYIPIVAALLFTAIALVRALGPADYDPRDFYIYRLGAELALRGENPYDVAKIRQCVSEKFPEENPAAESLSLNCGYFLPPMAILVYTPFAMLPWGATKVAWALVNGLAAYFIARLPLLLHEKDSPPPGFLVWGAVPFVLLLNPLALVTSFPVGQTSVVFLGCVAAGLLAFERGRPSLAAVAWVIPFIKPHLALPLVPLAWYLGGWRPAALLVALVAILNLAGATVVGGSPLFLREYANYLPQVRDAVRYNRVELNPSIASWNRLLFAAGGPLVELGLATTMAGYLVWYGLLIGRWAVSGGERPSAAWVTAATAAGALWCSQVLVYELLFLLVAVPWVRDLFANGYRLRGGLAIALLAVQTIPQAKMAALGIEVHHPLAVALFALLVLTGPMSPAHRRPPGSTLTSADSPRR